MPRAEKVAVVEEIRTKLTEADAAVLTEYRGLTVGDLAALRGALRPAGAEYKVFKNTLARRAVEESGHTELLPLLEGPVAIAFVRGDAVVAAKALRDFARGNDALVLKGGLLGERVLAPADIRELAGVPPRAELLARLAGGFQAPLTKAAGLFSAITCKVAYGLSAYVDQRIAAGEALPPEAPPVEADAPDGDGDTPTEATATEATAAETPAAETPATEDDAPDGDGDTPTE